MLSVNVFIGNGLCRQCSTCGKHFNTIVNYVNSVFLSLLVKLADKYRYISSCFNVERRLVEYCIDTQLCV